MKKTFKWIGAIILTPVLLFIILALLLYFPPVQNWAVKQVASYASESTGMEITVGHVNLEFPLDLAVEGVKVIQPNDSLPNVKDTVADIEKIVVDVELLPLFSSQVMIDELNFSNMKVNTTNFIHEARIKGDVGKLHLQAKGIDLGKETVKVNDGFLADARLSIELSDTVPPDTTPSSNFWKVDIDNLKVKNTDFTLHMPGDTMSVRAYLGDVNAQKGYLDLYKGLYQVDKLSWTGGKLNYDMNYEPKAGGLDFNHLALDSLTLAADSFYFCDSKLDIKIRRCNFREKSGISVTKLTGEFGMDSTKIWLPDLELRTPDSDLKACVDMDLNAFAEKDPGKIMASLHGNFGKQDLMRFMTDAPSSLRRQWPNYPLSVDGSVKGNMKRLDISGLTLKLPTALTAHAKGWVENITDIDNLRADVDIDAHSYNLGFATSMLDRELMKTINVPYGIGLKGNVKANGSKYGADLVASQGGGSLKAKAIFDSKVMSYKADIKSNAFPVQNFVPRMGLHPFTGYVTANGQGTDFLSPKTRLQAKARVVKFNYDGYNLDNIDAVVNMAGGKVRANIDSNNPLLKGGIVLDALTSTKKVQATVACDLSKADLYHLKIADEPLTASFCGQVDLATDMDEYYSVQGLLGDITIKDKDSTYRPEDVVLDILTRKDTTHAVVDCADFHLAFNASDGYKKLLKYGTNLSDEVQRQMKSRVIDQMALRKTFPNASLYLNTGKYNFIAGIIEKFGFTYKFANADLAASPAKGLNGTISVDSLVYLSDSICIDTIRLKFKSGQKDMAYEGYVRNTLENSPTFTAKFNGDILNNGTDFQVSLYDKDDKLGIQLPLAARMQNDGVRMSISGDDPVLGYKKFSVNKNNYVFMTDSGRVSADIVLKANDGQGIQVYTNDENIDALQDITLSLNKFDLEQVLSVIPYAPNVAGIFNGDFHVVQTKSDVTISSSINVDNMAYEGNKMGDVGTEFVYMPKEDGTHQVNGFLYSNGKEVASIDGIYNSEGDGYLDAKLGLARTPLNYLNGFIPDQLISLRGYGEGELTVKGSLSKPQIDGEIFLDSSYIASIPYGVEMRIANDPVRIVGSHLLFENFELFANNDESLNISGEFDFSDLDRMMLNIRMRAQNFQIIDAKENPRSEAYGKAFVNFFGSMRGPLSSLNMFGRLEVLGTTDMTYILRESELTTDNQLDELVKFTDFNDSTMEVVDKPKPEGLNMTMSISVDESAHIVCALNAEHTNYIDLMGGGDLRLSYNPVTDLQLTGRYTLSNGEMKYSLPVIPLKTFNIQDGSYIEFTGNAFNPTLSITATESVKATVNEGASNGRQVDFRCGVKLSKTLESPGILFIIEAPNDMTIQDELNTMSIEEQSKIAIAMLASGMYLADGNTQAFTMNSALSSFLNSEINNIAGSAMRSMGLDLGMTVDNTTTASGGIHTDYNFKFAKRFWNNRLSIIIGGQVSTGADLDQNGSSNNTFFNNVELQYRLNQSASQYLSLFYDNNTYDWLEGRIGEYGAGFTWKRKLQHFKDIFKFKNEEPLSMPSMRRDSVRVQGKTDVKSDSTNKK